MQVSFNAFAALALSFCDVGCADACCQSMLAELEQECSLTDGTCGMLLQVVVRCIWRLLLPLLDLGYQVDIRIMNAAHYAVPQLRRVTFSFPLGVPSLEHAGCPSCSDCFVTSDVHEAPMHTLSLHLLQYMDRSPCVQKLHAATESANQLSLLHDNSHLTNFLCRG